MSVCHCVTLLYFRGVQQFKRYCTVQRKPIINSVFIFLHHLHKQPARYLCSTRLCVLFRLKVCFLAVTTFLPHLWIFLRICHIKAIKSMDFYVMVSSDIIYYLSCASTWEIYSSSTYDTLQIPTSAFNKYVAFADALFAPGKHHTGTSTIQPWGWQNIRRNCASLKVSFNQLLWTEWKAFMIDHKKKKEFLQMTPWPHGGQACEWRTISVHSIRRFGPCWQQVVHFTSLSQLLQYA